MRIIAVTFLSIALASCGIYNSEWDCPPGEGVRCKPVSQVLDMIVEKESGEDTFVPDLESAAELKKQEKQRGRIPVKSVDEPKKLYLLKEQDGERVVVEATEVAP